MILAAALMVFLGLGLFVAGVLTGAEAYYWGCVAACVTAAVLLVLARRRLGAGSASAQTDTTTGAARTGAASTGAARTGAAADRPADAAVAASSGATAEEPPVGDPSPSGRGTAPAAADRAGRVKDLPDPPVEEVEVTDLLLVVDLTDEVYVIDERPRYHLAGCLHLRGHTPIPLPIDEARTDGFTPCAVCAPDRNLAEQVRARKAHGSG